MFKAALTLIGLKMKNINYDIVSVHFATEAMLMHWLKPVLGWPYIYVCEGYSDLEAKVAKYAGAQLAISRHIVENYERNFGYRPQLIPVGVDTKRFLVSNDKISLREKILGAGFENKFIVLTVCRLFPDKDLPTLIKAAKKVNAINSDIAFVIVGDGGERPAIENMIKEFNLSDAVILAGNVSDKDLPDFYALSDIFILTEVRSGFSGGIVFLEAMSIGLPIIATDAGGTRETLEGIGIVLPLGDTEKLAENILRVFNDCNLYQKMRDRGLEKVKVYDWDSLISRYLQAYEAVALRGRN